MQWVTNYRFIFLKTAQNPFSRVKISVSQGHIDRAAGNTGYSLYLSGPGEVQAVACTEHGKDKFNIVHFVCNCITYST